MDIIIQSLGFTAGEMLESFVHEKLDKLEKEADIIRANVVLFTGSDANPNNCYCEIRLEIPGNDLFVKKSSDNFDKAIVDAVDTIQHSLRKTKEKQIDRTHRRVP